MKKNKLTYNHAFVDYYLKTRHNKKGMSKFVDKTKKEGSVDKLSLCLARIRKFDEKVDYNFFGTQWPFSIKELGDCNNYYYYPDSLDNEILWVASQVKKNKSKIKTFIEYRDNIEKLILMGLYDRAISTLDSMQEEIGLSIWSIEMRLLLLHRLGKEEDAFAFVTRINESKKNATSGFVPILTHYINKRSRVDVPAYDFDMVLENRMKRNVTPSQDYRHRYLLFRLNMFKSDDSADCLTNLLMDSTNALVDRYVLLLNILKTLFVTNIKKRKEFSLYACLLYNYTKDSSLLQFIAYSNAQMPDEYYDRAYVEIIDRYYTGKYAEVCELAKRHIEGNVVNFDVLKFYCRSLIFLKNGYKPISDIKDSIINQIVENMYHVMSGDNDKNYLYKLYQISKNIHSFGLTSALDTYIKEERSDSPKIEMGLLASRIFDPYVIKMFDKDEHKLDYLQKGQEKFPSSVVLTYNINKIEGETIADENIVDYIRKVDNAQILFNKKEYDGCIRVMKEVLDANEDCTPIVQTAVRCIYDSYTAQGLNEKAVSFYAEWLVANESYVTKISTGELIGEMKRNRYRGMRLSLKLMIFVLRNALYETDKSYIVESYAKYKNLKTIEDIINDIKSADPQMQECLLCLMLDDDFFNNSAFVKKTKEILENQNHIILRLLELDSDNEKYQMSAKIISQQMIVYSGVEKLDGGKIYADVQSIIKYEADEARRLFDQLTVQKNLENNTGTLLIVVDTSKNKEDLEEKESLGMACYFTDDSLKEISLQLFNSISKPYLKSKFGIGAYLSARIRHGVFDGQIQSAFLEKDLLLSMSNKEYTPSTYWNSYYDLTDNDRKTLYHAQTVFSKAINDLIIDYKKDVLQIKVDDKDTGLFDYRLSDDEICYYVRQAYGHGTEFENFALNLMCLLNAKTNECLENIKKDIRNRLKPLIIRHANNLIIATESISNTSFVTAFRERVEDSKREIEAKLLKMEKWFNIIDSKQEDFDLLNHIIVIWEICQKMSPRTHCRLSWLSEKNDLAGLMIKGNFNIHIGDLFRIFFSNMIKHSKQEILRNFTISHSIENNILTLVMTNNFDGDENETNQRMKKSLGSMDMLQKEGGSGLAKAQKTVKFDLKCHENLVDAVIQNGKCISTIKVNLEPLKL